MMLREVPASSGRHASDGTARSSAPRDGFIDALRAIALIRVVIWHATGDPRSTWVITTMPLMFFVAGSLLLASLERRAAPVVLRRRLKRLLVPFWFFGGLVLAVVALVDLARATDATALSADRLWAWIVPLINPTASAWEAGWASSPLWYLRAYLWILLLSPLLLRAWRRSPAALLASSVAVMAIAQLAAHRTQAGPDALVWIVGDLGIYTFFALLGFAHHEGRLHGLRRRDLMEWMAIAIAATAVAWRFAGSDDGVVNHSYIALLTLGVAWLCAALLARPWLGRAPSVPVVGPILYWMTRRAMSIYLWHSPAIVGAYWLLQKFGMDPSMALILGITTILVVVASTATGWIEDVAAGRRAELVPLPARSTGAPHVRLAEVLRTRRQMVVGAAVGVALSLVATAVLVPANASAARASTNSVEAASEGLALPPAPSGRPDSNATTKTTDVAVADTSDAGRISTGADLQMTIDEWRAEHGVDGVRLGIVTGEGRRILTSGSEADGTTLDPNAELAITSITKTMTAAIVLQLADEGRIGLDEPLPVLERAPELSANHPDITARQLLDHSSGLVPYQQAIGYRADTAITAEEAVRLSALSPPEWSPGEQGGYSNAGFLALGLLIEQVTGVSYDEAVRQRLGGPLAMDATYVDSTPTSGWVGHAAGGVVSTVDDLLTWGDALYRRGQVLEPASLSAMTAVDPVLMSGLGAFPVCPCPDRSDGTVGFVSIGHNGGSAALHYAPAADVLIVVSFTESFWTDQLDQTDVYDLLARVRAAVA